RIAVVDGLGHGPAAAEAARLALEAVGKCLEEGVTEALSRCHAALAGTRGAALTVAEVDVTRGVLTFSGVGNVEARVWRAETPEKAERPIVYRGVVGATLPRLRSFELPLAGDWRLLVHTDGVSARWDVSRLEEGLSLQGMADEVVERWGRVTDEATVVLAGPAGPAGPAGETGPARGM
ncbi:MAG TPA: SpoIIE family protein phosphatase, partial [Chloroflexota bacterium]|nr:SpoIIE family protein phosphatase [Chloroflexota bacterium]